MKTFLCSAVLLIVCKLLVVIAVIFLKFEMFVGADTFTLGYLTGSQRSPGNLDYQRPGKESYAYAFNNSF